MNIDEVVRVVTAFVTRTRGAPRQPIGPETKLFQEGLIDSFGIVELSAEIEKAAGRPIPEGELLPEDFESPRVLAARLSEIA